MVVDLDGDAWSPAAKLLQAGEGVGEHPHIQVIEGDLVNHAVDMDDDGGPLEAPLVVQSHSQCI